MTCLLYVHNGPDTFVFLGPYDFYNLALLAGQSHGHGQFYIATKDRVPTRATQLGEELDSYVKYKITKKRNKKKELIEQD